MVAARFAGRVVRRGAEKWRAANIPFCEAKHRLMGDFPVANHELMELHIQQTQGVIDGDLDFTRFDDLIHVAREKKDDAKYALITHLEQHHC